MQSLSSIVDRESLPVAPFHLDHFQSRVREEMHLEFFFARCRFLITPTFRYTKTGDATHEEEQRLQAILAQRQRPLEDLKRLLIYSLALHSALLDTNSYFISVNDHLVIARFVGFGEGFEVKLYTLRPEDLPSRYSDKLYLGRDLLLLDVPRRPHFGLGYLRDSLREQLGKLKRRLESLTPPQVQAAVREEFLGDLDELVTEVSAGADAILGGFPASGRGEALPEKLLLELNPRFRDVKHLLIEMDGVLAELEQSLFERAKDAARYVTKLRKDVTNDINYIMLKVNGRISDAVNGIRI
jgi:hypothetical protein